MCAKRRSDRRRCRLEVRMPLRLVPHRAFPDADAIAARQALDLATAIEALRAA